MKIADKCSIKTNSFIIIEYSTTKMRTWSKSRYSVLKHRKIVRSEKEVNFLNKKKWCKIRTNDLKWEKYIKICCIYLYIINYKVLIISYG
jgi:hypothetical protein